jgi:hypothetical protein
MSDALSYRSEPKPHNIIPGEETKKSLTIQNNLSIPFAVGQTSSTWESVNFVIEFQERPDKNIRWLATLMPTDKLQLDFKQRKIEP